MHGRAGRRCWSRIYRDRSGVLSDDELAYSLVLAGVATHVVLGLQAGAPAGELRELLARPGS